MIAPARRAATEVLAAVDAGRWDLATALAQAHPSLADARDRALLTELATGVQRWKLALDFAIHALTKRQPADLDADVRATLRLGLYQLQHATRIPASAVVNDAVEIVKRGPTRSAAGMVNAVLRRVVREGPPRLPEPPRVPVDDPRWRMQALAWLAIAHSHPAWLVERWLDRFGIEATEAWVRYDNTPADVTVWPLPGVGSGESGVGSGDSPIRDPRSAIRDSEFGNVEGTPTRFVPGGIVLANGRDALPHLRAGSAYAQDEASAAIAVVAGTVGRGRVLDACAAPGGKSLAMRSWLPPDARLLANDMRTRRIALLAATLGRAAGPRIPIVRSDATRLPFDRSIDTMLIDAPCSGLGTLRRDPDVRWRRTAADLAAFATTQRSMIEEGLRALAPAGRLVYATCSSEPEENESLVAALLQERPELRRLDLRQEPLPPSMTSLLTDEGALRTWPHVHGLDAFFAVALTRP
ncbi:Ribosomal RNA small subunit methyltransferase B [Luteitalea pratensis]|uniref:Ribosomal RNA small subunit methyltransferase B n=1 Tax=Luteitalea pratensis TaxID=1855912 RepID=A0A143PRS2_LUTPR|nr:transcription antitermination factor NusB [Luteitalea pratensis]AMY10514.1 Ribosomal RNA small subunit methyltransferase B [Luteitalea pratensis]